MAKDNKTLGTFRLDGIPAAPRGLPQIEVTFDIDANGILDVTAKDKATGKEQKIQITASTNLSESEVESMVNAAKQHEAEDSKLRELIQARNQADQMIYATEKSLNELGDTVAEAEKSRIEGMIADLKTAVTSDDISHIKTLTEQVQQASYALSQQLYQSQDTPGSNGSANGHSGSESKQENPDDVVEGEFQEM
jgi:molecular chaperone DnaK